MFISLRPSTIVESYVIKENANDYINDMIHTYPISFPTQKATAHAMT